MSDLDDNILDDLKAAFDVDGNDTEKQLEFSVEVNHQIGSLADQSFFLDQQLKNEDVQISTEDRTLLNVIERFRELDLSNPEVLKRVCMLSWLQYLTSLEDHLSGRSSFNIHEVLERKLPTDLADGTMFKVDNLPYPIIRTINKNPNTAIDDILYQYMADSIRTISTLNELFGSFNNLASSFTPIIHLIQTLKDLKEGNQAVLDSVWYNVIKSITLSRFADDEDAENISESVNRLMEDFVGTPIKLKIDLDNIPSLRKMVFGSHLAYEKYEEDKDKDTYFYQHPIVDDNYLIIRTPKIENFNPLKQFAEEYGFYNSEMFIGKLDSHDTEICCEDDSLDRSATVTISGRCLEELRDEYVTLVDVSEILNGKMQRINSFMYELINGLVKQSTELFTDPAFKDRVGFVETRAITFVVEYAINHILLPLARFSRSSGVHECTSALDAFYKLYEKATIKN